MPCRACMHHLNWWKISNFTFHHAWCMKIEIWKLNKCLTHSLTLHKSKESFALIIQGVTSWWLMILVMNVACAIDSYFRFPYTHFCFTTWSILLSTSEIAVWSECAFTVTNNFPGMSLKIFKTLSRVPRYFLFSLLYNH